MILEKGMRIQLDGALRDELQDVTVQETLRSLASITPLYRGAMQEVSTRLNILDEEMGNQLAHNPIHHMESRIKAPGSILHKMQKYKLPFRIDLIREHILDIAGIRVVCPYQEDVYRMAKLLAQQPDLRVLRKRDYIARPKENGYRSLHLIVETPVYLSERWETAPVEVQIRTLAMDMWASLEHEMRYKAAHDAPPEIAEKLKSCAAVLANVDTEMQTLYHALEADASDTPVASVAPVAPQQDDYGSALIVGQ